MTDTEMLGYLASLLVLATFCTGGMVSLRILAIASNLAFIGYAWLAGIRTSLGRCRSRGRSRRLLCLFR